MSEVTTEATQSTNEVVEEKTTEAVVEASAEAKVETKTEEKVEAAPEEVKEIAYDLKLPKDSKLQEADLEAVKSFAKEAKLSNEHAQKMLEERFTIQKSWEKTQLDSYNRQVEAWKKEIQSDPNHKVVVEKAFRAVDKYGDSDFKQDLDRTGLGNHPGLVRLLARVQDQFEADKKIDGKPAVAAHKEDWEIIYSKKEK
jgi:hypothetical protein